jgi:DNA-binding CsgD family transcriptional regulator
MPQQYVIVRRGASAIEPLLEPEKIASLTEREAAILELVSGGLSNVLTALHLGISGRTVSKHLEHIYAKLDVTNRTAAAAIWYRNRGD